MDLHRAIRDNAAGIRLNPDVARGLPASRVDILVARRLLALVRLRVRQLDLEDIGRRTLETSAIRREANAECDEESTRHTINGAANARISAKELSQLRRGKSEHEAPERSSGHERDAEHQERERL